MESFKIESLNKTVNINGIELLFNLDDNEFINKSLKIREILDSFDNMVSLADDLKNLVEDMFGKGICKSLFGIENPSHVLLIELAKNISEIVINTISNRQSQISEKYNAEREGNV